MLQLLLVAQEAPRSKAPTVVYTPCTMVSEFFKGTDSAVFQLLLCQACDFLCNMYVTG